MAHLKELQKAGLQKLTPATPEKLFLTTTDCLTPATWAAQGAIAAATIASDRMCLTWWCGFSKYASYRRCA